MAKNDHSSFRQRVCLFALPTQCRIRTNYIIWRPFSKNLSTRRIILSFHWKPRLYRLMPEKISFDTNPILTAWGLCRQLRIICYAQYVYSNEVLIVQDQQNDFAASNGLSWIVYRHRSCWQLFFAMFTSKTGIRTNETTLEHITLDRLKFRFRFIEIKPVL